MPEEPDQRHPAPPLPVEIWTMIAAHLSTKDWVRASGTCRSTRDVQPSSISLTPSQIGAFQWLVKHLQETVSLSLDMWHTEVLGIADGASMMLSSCSTMQKLATLKLTAPVPMDDEEFNYALKQDRDCHLELMDYYCEDCWDLQRKQKDEWAPWLAQFTQQAGHVQKLSLTVTTFAVPLANTIKHLVLNVREDISTQGIKHLRQLSSLQTLCIMHEAGGHADEWVYDIRISDRHSPCRITLGTMDLRCCHMLRAVRFVMMLPVKFLVARGCTVSMQCDSCAFCHEWKSWGSFGKPHGLLREGVCTNWHVEQVDCEVYDSAGELAETLASDSGPMAISSLRLECADFCSSEYPFIMGACLRGLTDLEVRSGKDVRIETFAGVRLQRFHVIAASVSLSVPDLADFAASIQDVYFVGDLTCLMTTTLLNEHLHVKMRVSPELGGRTEVQYPPGTDWVQPGEDICKCGACEACLGFEEIFK